MSEERINFHGTGVGNCEVVDPGQSLLECHGTELSHIKSSVELLSSNLASVVTRLTGDLPDPPEVQMNESTPTLELKKPILDQYAKTADQIKGLLCDAHQTMGKINDII